VRCRHRATVHVDDSPAHTAVHLLATIAKLVRPGGVLAVVAESLLLNTSWSSAAARGVGRRT
jgi:hypothetical protein